MGKLLLSVFLIFAIAHNPVSAQTKTAAKNDLFWFTDINKAGELSKKTGKPIFAFFTGSDWCIWCHKIEHDVFEKPEFKTWAAKNVILLELDFPKKKQLAPELAQQNDALQKTFRIQGFPTIWMFYLTKENGENKFNISALGSLGYPEGAQQGKEQFKFLAQAEQILKNAPGAKTKSRS